MLLGLLAPTSGHIRLFGELPSRRTRARLGYVPQSLGLYEDLTVAENLAFSAAAYGSQDATLGGDLAGARDVLVRELPLGLRRRAAFAIALGHHPDLLVLDEPTSGVDPLQRARLWDTIRASAELGAGVLVTTHHLAEAAQCDRLVVLASGRVVASGSLPDVVGDTTAVEVRTPTWEAAFTALDVAGLPVSLVGRTLRVPGNDPAVVARVLADADIPAEVGSVPASFEETFVVLAGEPA
jgi:ABC-2 type transport system ATP-binding protein/ribosome-dependent ATPase